jgi:hypothetical protein
MAIKVTQECFEKVETERCEKCRFLHTFYNISDFCSWSLKQTNTIQIAHNLKVIFLVCLFFSFNLFILTLKGI